ncbi:MAG: DUF309 domain-containing protein [Candidatus Caenarcaniphilales bacterium]|nr:DUF309 domain-containing protein [Candidatus Caenarcaniphilales bacterium]
MISSWFKKEKTQKDKPLMLKSRSISTDTIFLKNLFRSEIFDIDFRMAVDDFNSAKYAKAYKTLFKLWQRSETCNRKFFYQGLLKTCAALELIQQSKLEGSKRTYRAAINHLLNFSSLERPINIAKLVNEVIAYFDFIDHDLDPLNNDIAPVSKPKIEISF